MKFYYISDEYISYLSQFDSKISMNKKESRPYVGIVFSINNIEYYAPLTSPKPKHKKMHNKLDFRKIKNGELGAINLNLMIPVPSQELILLDIPSIKDEGYRRLLQKQKDAITDDWNNVINNAQKLYEKCASAGRLTKYAEQLKSRCCNFKELEKACSEYSKVK